MNQGAKDMTEDALEQLLTRRSEVEAILAQPGVRNAVAERAAIGMPISLLILKHLQTNQQFIALIKPQKTIDAQMIPLLWLLPADASYLGLFFIKPAGLVMHCEGIATSLDVLTKNGNDDALAVLQNYRHAQTANALGQL